MPSTTPTVLSVSASGSYTMSKPVVGEIRLVAGLGVEGDAHSGATVKHRSRVRRDPTQPNLRQVHLIHSELFDELAAKGFEVTPGMMGENITTSGIELLSLPQDTLLRIGGEALVRVTGLRNPCAQLDGLQQGLMQAVLDKKQDGTLVRKTGIMGVVEVGGTVRPGDAIAIELPEGNHLPLEPV